jgi:hypothetical protein
MIDARSTSTSLVGIQCDEDFSYCFRMSLLRAGSLLFPFERTSLADGTQLALTRSPVQENVVCSTIVLASY